ncbi:MAG: hypothetical protein LC620_05165, partial [Halobacteriales archaeon]|nr:hypothetical protein [Halobacteriales archaeon]
MRVVFVGRDRKVWREALLAALTLGVTRRIWLFHVNREVDGHEALGLRHGVTAAFLAAPLAGIAAVIALGAAGIPFLPVGAAVLVLSFLPSGYLTVQTARRVGGMTAGSSVKYGPAAWVGLAGLIPILGSILFFIPWTQGRLNRFWAQER